MLMQFCTKLFSTGHAPASLEEKVHTRDEACHCGVQGREVELFRVHLPHQQQTLVCGVRQQGKLQEVVAGHSLEPVADQAPLMQGVPGRRNAVASLEDCHQVQHEPAQGFAAGLEAVLGRAQVGDERQV